MAGLEEFSKMRQQEVSEPDVIMASVQRALRVAITREVENLDTHLSFLAPFAFTSPYIGLFGTVWGFMHSFQGLLLVKQATIARFAPGISKHLLPPALVCFPVLP